MTDEAELVDKNQIKDLKAAFSEDFAQFLNVYFKDFEDRHKELIVAVNAKEIEKIARLAHAMKGSSLNVGALALGLVCGDIEAASRLGIFEQAMVPFNKLENLYQKTKTTMIALIL